MCRALLSLACPWLEELALPLLPKKEQSRMPNLNLMTPVIQATRDRTSRGHLMHGQPIHSLIWPGAESCVQTEKIIAEPIIWFLLGHELRTTGRISWMRSRKETHKESTQDSGQATIPAVLLLRPLCSWSGAQGLWTGPVLGTVLLFL